MDDKDTSMMYEEDVEAEDPTPAPGTEIGSPDPGDAETSTPSTTGATATLEDMSAEEAAMVEEVMKQVAQGESPWMGKRPVQLAPVSPVDILLTKMEKWLVQQPEWAFILAAPRPVRRQAITLIAKRLTTIPNRYKSY